MDKYMRFLNIIIKAENKSKRHRRRLMERELKKLHNDERGSDRVDGEHGR